MIHLICRLKNLYSNKDAESSIIRTLSKRGHDLFSKFVSGLFSDRKPENSETVSDENYEIKTTWDDKRKISTIDENANEMKMNNNQKSGIINKDLDDSFEYDDKDKDGLKDPGKTKQHGNLKKFNDSKGYTCNKQIARTNSTYKIEPISITNLVLLSILFGIVGARRLENLDGNELGNEENQHG